MNQTQPIDLVHLFSHHPPREGQPERYEAIRAAAREFTRVVLENAPPCADQSAAVRHIREAVWTANAAIALEGETQSLYYAGRQEHARRVKQRERDGESTP